MSTNRHKIWTDPRIYPRSCVARMSPARTTGLFWNYRLIGGFVGCLDAVVPPAVPEFCMVKQPPAGIN